MMNSACPHANLSYSKWRLQALRRLCADVEFRIVPQLLFLHPRPSSLTLERRQNFHQSAKRTRGNFKEVTRSAKFKAVQLRLAKRSESGNEYAESTTDPPTPSEFVNARAQDTWTPYSKASVEEIQDLVKDLQAMTKGALSNGNEGGVEEIPFEFGSKIYARKKPGQPESPLERRLPWDMKKKLQVHEVETDKRLENNVWAQMLASPVRMERGTKARLPQDLMTAWGVVQNPENEEDYLLPIELSDLDAFRQSLQQGENTDDTQKPSEDAQYGTKPTGSRLSGPRIQMLPSKVLVQAMTDSFTDIYSKPDRDQPRRTFSGKIMGTVIPFRWRYKQEELTAFQRTRQNFNEVLKRTPDKDEPDMEALAKLENLKWQSDIAERIERIMVERVLIALEAVVRDNASGRAVQQRRIFALPVPEDGRLVADEKGRILESRGQTSISGSISHEKIQETATASGPEWLHGGIFLHIGTPTQYSRTIKKWNQAQQTSSNDGTRSTATDLIPTFLTINNQNKLPVFNLATLLKQTHPTRIQDTIKSHPTMTLEFWQQDAQPQSQSTDPTPTYPNSILDTGEQVPSSIVTPNTNTPTSNTPDSPSPPGTKHQSKNEGEYLILIKPRARHANTLVREIWALWRYLGGRRTIDPKRTRKL